MKGKPVVRRILVIAAAVLVPFLTATVLHPIWHLQVVFLSLISLFLAGLAAFMAVKGVYLWRSSGEGFGIQWRWRCDGS